MTKDRLEQCASLKREVEHLKQEIMKRSRVIVSDTVAGSQDEYPYCKHAISVYGVEPPSVDKLCNVWRKKVVELDAQLLEIEQFLGTVKDSKLRRIIRLRYIDGKTWNATARRVYGHPCGNSARMFVERFLNKF